MTSRSYFGKMNSILGSVVPLAMFSPRASIPPSPSCYNSTEQQPSLVDLQLSANYNTSSICSVPLLCLKFVEPIAIRKFARTSKVMMKTSIFLHLMVVMNDAEGGRSILQSNILLKLKSLPPHIQYIYIYAIHRHNTHNHTSYYSNLIHHCII